MSERIKACGMTSVLLQPEAVRPLSHNLSILTSFELKVQLNHSAHFSAIRVASCSTGTFGCKISPARLYAQRIVHRFDTKMQMSLGQLPLHKQIPLLREVLSSNSTLLTVLNGAATLEIPNWYLAGGAISQTIWNHVSSLPPETGIRDYDLVYYDASDLSYEAEDKVIQAGKKLFADLPVEVEIRNQARVHLWFEKRYGMPCSPHSSVEAGIDTWISTSAMVGVRPEEGSGEWTVYAPRGLSDYFNMVVRPNPILGTREVYEQKAERWKAIWKSLSIEPWPA